MLKQQFKYEQMGCEVGYVLLDLTVTMTGGSAEDILWRMNHSIAMIANWLQSILIC